jgi:4-coumarate--CoA ligase
MQLETFMLHTFLYTTQVSQDVGTALRKLTLNELVGLLNFCILNVQRDCTTVIMSKFSLALLLQAIQRFRIMYLLLVPPVAVSLIKSPLARQYDISSIKFLLCSAAPLGSDTSKQLEDIFKGNTVRSRQGWGMTEATIAITLFAPDESDPTHSGVGYLVANIQAKIVDEGKEVGYGEEGEALIRGPNIFKGYYKNPIATEEAWTKDRWPKTGDYVVVQENGLFSVVDRKKV